jgi:hypothetical protein
MIDERKKKNRERRKTTKSQNSRYKSKSKKYQQREGKEYTYGKRKDIGDAKKKKKTTKKKTGKGEKNSYLCGGCGKVIYE